VILHKNHKNPLSGDPTIALFKAKAAKFIHWLLNTNKSNCNVV